MLDALPEGSAGEAGAAAGQENGRGRAGGDELRPARFEVALQGGHGLAPHRHHPLFVALADDGDEAGLQVQLFQPQPAEFGQPQSDA